MKKMNFYFNATRCCTFLLPVLMMLFSVSTFAGNGDNPSAAKTVKAGKLFVMSATAVATNPTAKCATDGSITVSVNESVTPIAYPRSIRVRVFKRLLLGQAATTTVYNTTTVFTGAAGSTIPYTVTIPNLGSGEYITTVEQVVVGSTGPTIITTLINGQVNTLTPTSSAPTFTAANNFAVSGDAQCTATITPAQIGAAADDCGIRAVYIGEGGPLTAATLSAAITAAAPTVTTTTLDLIGSGAHTVYAYAIDVEGNLVVSAPVTVTVNDVTPPVFTPYTAAGLGVFTATTANLSCGGSFTTTIPCGATVAFPAPAAVDVCGNVAVVPTFVGQPGVNPNALSPGTYVLTYRAVDAAGNATTCSYNVTVAGRGGALVCPGNVNVTMTSCPQILTWTDLGWTNGFCTFGLVIEIGRGGIWTNATPTGGFVQADVDAAARLNSDDIGKTIQYRIRDFITGNSCWGNMTIEDKTRPTITCPANIVLTCEQNPFDTKITGDIAGTLNQNSTTNNDGSFVDCSKANQAFTDEVIANADCPLSATALAAAQARLVAIGSAVVLGPNTIKVIARTWTVKDVWGNISAPCTQIIVVERAPRIPALFVAAPYAGSCTVVDKTPGALNSWPFYDKNIDGKQDFPDEPSIKIGESPICNVQVTGYTDVTLPLCNNGVKIIRTWTVVDMCQVGAAMVIKFDQILTFEDKIAPTVAIVYQNYDKVDGSYCFNMLQGDTNMPMTQATVATKLLNPVTVGASATAITLQPLADVNTCGMATVRFTMNSSDPSCGNNAVTYSSTDSRIRFNGALTATVAGGTSVTVSGVIMASQGTAFTVFVTDGCGNQTTQVFNVNIVDNVTPQTICIEKTRATIGSDGKVRIFTSTFDNGSRDNCGIARIHVRRMNGNNGTYDPATCSGTTVTDPCFYDYVEFGCADIGKVVQVVVRAVDAAGNFSDCMVDVTVDDKTGPVCMNPDPISFICTDVRLSSYKALFTTPVAFDNCGIRAIDSTDNRELVLACGKGSVTRTWTFTDCGDKKTTCSQTLTVTPVYGFTVPKLADEQKACALGANDIVTIMDNDRRSILASASLTTFSGTKTCSAPIVETEYWKYSSSQYCQIYRIRYTIIDKCAPFYGYTIGTPGTCNVMRSGDGSRQWGTPNAACTQVESVVGATVNGEQQHIVIYERYIYVNDVTAPISTLPVAPDPCTTYTGAPGAGSQVTNIGCGFNYYTKLKGEDNCGTGTAASDPSTVTFMWRVINKATGAQLTGSNGTGTTADVYLTNLAFGKYTICYRVTDLCGNMSQEYCYDIEGKDCKAPQILVHNKVLELAGRTGVRSTGMADLLYIDIRNNVFDNCDGDLTNSSKITLEKGGLTSATRPTAAVGTQSLRFTCDDLYASGGTATTSKVVEVRVWAVDAAGNWNYVVTPITVQDNIGICNNTFTVAVSGSALTEGNAAVANVAVSASVNGAVVATTDAVNSTFTLGVAPATNVQVRAAKTNNDDAASGVTTFDIAKVSQHVLDIEKLATPYKLIAADVDKSGVIDALDMLHMRRFILKITPSLPGGNFRFVNKAYAFRNPSDPFGEDFPEVVNIASLTSNTSANFVAVKLGDVNDSYAGTTVRGSRSLTLNANDMNVVAGNEYTVNISADKMDATAFQGTFSFNGATVKSVKAGNLANMTDGNFGIFANAVTTSWNGKTQDAADVMTITFVANKSGKLSDMLTVNSALTQSVANDATGNEMNVNLKFNTGKVAGGEFALYQNQPNPVAGETTIGFNLPKDGAARLTVTSVDGKVVKVINGEYKAGYNTVTINKSDIQASGVFYYRLETADHSASKKMVIME